RGFARKDPDTLIDAFDELEDALSKCVAALSLSGLAAALFQLELDAVVAETDLAQSPWLVVDLLAGEVPGDLVEGARRLFSLAALVRRRPQLHQLLEAHAAKPEVLAEHLLQPEAPLDDEEHRFAQE